MRIFLTGATGSLGSHLALRILKETDHDVTCLVRDYTREAGTARLEESLKAYDPSFTVAAFESRMKVVCGDMTLPNLGIPEGAWTTLAKNTDLTIHAAALTNLVAKETTAIKVNVQGTKEMIKFAEATPERRLMHVSTYSVCGDKLLTNGFVFKETDHDVGQKFPHMPYQHSKFLAEAEVRKSTCVWTIVRPGHIFGDNETGRFFTKSQQSDSLFWDLLKSAYEFKCSFVTNFIFDITPVNYVTSAMLSLIQFGDTGTYHLCQKDALTFENVLNVMVGMGYDIEKVSIEEYRNHLKDGSLFWKGKQYTSVTTQVVWKWFHLKELCFDNSAKIDTSLAQQKLEPRGIFARPTDMNLLENYFKNPGNVAIHREGTSGKAEPSATL